MNNKFKSKSLVFLLIAVLLLVGIAPKEALADEVPTDHETTVNIHKIETTAGPKELEADQLEEGITDLKSWFGDPEAKGLAGVEFYVYKVSQKQFEEMSKDSGDYKTAKDVEEYLGANFEKNSTGPTNGEGLTTVTLKEGYYWIIEKPLETIASSLAVPFGLTLPYTNSTGTKNLDTIHVYPKNTLQPTPTVKKELDGNESQYIGQEFSWKVTSTVPKGIKEYTRYEFEDILDNKLDYVGVEFANSTNFTKDEHYIVPDAEEVNKDRKLTVKLTETGIAKLYELAEEAKEKGEDNFVLEYKIITKINNNAVMGDPIYNKITLKFENPHISGEDISNEPEVVTGGHKFKKTINTAEGNGLAGAEFIIKNSEGKYIVQDPKTLAVTFADTKEEAKKAPFTSTDKGTFEVKGLAYGEYTLTEVKAPSGYALPTKPDTTFTVGKDSYDESALIIINKAITIPQTGGMGTVIFTVVGLSVMALAVVFYRKSNRA